MSTLTQQHFQEMGWGYRSYRMVTLLRQLTELGRSEGEGELIKF